MPSQTAPNIFHSTSVQSMSLFLRISTGVYWRRLFCYLASCSQSSCVIGAAKKVDATNPCVHDTCDLINQSFLFFFSRASMHLRYAYDRVWHRKTRAKAVDTEHKM